ncbi:MAG TPA: hypothetical protein VFN62_03720, partial [Acidobacteriaceae bacterium]|nr:hypothetical protein [Acidobacteriaceae bacterium]
TALLCLVFFTAAYFSIAQTAEKISAGSGTLTYMYAVSYGSCPQNATYPPTGTQTYTQYLFNSFAFNGQSLSGSVVGYSVPNPNSDCPPSGWQGPIPYPLTGSGSTVYFTPSTSGVGSATVNQGTPTVTAWPTASAITYGQSLASSTLSGGSASVSGTFAWTTPGTVPPPGTQSESVTFTPSDTADYSTVTGYSSVLVNVLTFSNTKTNTGVYLADGGGPALVPFGNGLNSKALDLIYVGHGDDVSVAYSTDGLSYTDVGRISVPYENGVAELDCTPEWSDHCGVAAASYAGHLYVAYNDWSCNCLYVLKGTPVSGSGVFTWSLDYTDPSHQLVTTPAMLVTTDSSSPNLIVRYGTTAGTHEAFSSVLNGQTGTWSTRDSDSVSRAQSTLFSVNGTNYAIDLNNPDTNNVPYVTELDDNGVAIPGTTNQFQGGDSSNVGEGFSSVIYKSFANCALVTSLAANTNELQIFSRSDYYANFDSGRSWYPQTYSNMKYINSNSYGIYGDFAITYYSGSIAVVYRGDSNGDLYAATGTPYPCDY